MKYVGSVAAAAVLAAALAGCGTPPEPLFQFEEGDRIAYIGNALADRKQHDGYLETYLHAGLPGHELVFRNLGYTGDQVAHRPRAHDGFGDPDFHLANVGASVIFAFFGYNESFDDDPDQFYEDLVVWIDHTRAQRYTDGGAEDGNNGENANGDENETEDGPPRIILFSPIAHEDLGDRNLPDASENNRRLAEYTEAMARAAADMDVLFVNLFEATQALYAESDEPLTINGVHLNREGNRQVGRFIAVTLLDRPLPDDEGLGALHETVLDKNWHWHKRYRAPSGNDVWGSRAELHGNFETLQRELEMLDAMTANRDEAIWAVAGGDTGYEVDDSNVPDPVEVETNFTGADDVVFLGGEEAIEEMTLADGLAVNLFASEEDFPEIANPVQMQVDAQGRLWVAAWPNYPKWEPLKELKDGLHVLEDTTGDGRADALTTFATISNPTGFEFWNGGVIVASAPNLWFLKDTTGDGQADEEILLMGAIDSADTHHTANNLVYGPDGYLYYQRGVFHLHNIETPWEQSQEGASSALYRFNPRTHRFDYVVENSPNPHGISFDRWGYQYITDATSGSPFQVYVDHEADRFEKRRLFDQTVRPVPGNKVLSSSHFPEEFENNFLILNTIAFLGIKRYELIYDDNTVSGEEIGDLIESSDPNFRPTDVVVGADGALYLSDWHNPIIGHMQHNLRDPMRDHEHGRIYRITAEGQPLDEPVEIHEAPLEALLELYHHPVNRVRHRVRVELSGRDTADVIPAVEAWAAQLDASSEEDALPLLEALWTHQQHNSVNRNLLGALLESPNEHVRYAARRVEWEWGDRPTDHLAAALDPSLHMDHAEPSAPDIELDLTDEDVAELTIIAVAEEMRFDVTEFTVRAGQSVVLTLDNPDYLPHNLIIVNPGTADEIVAEAIALGGDGFAMDFAPDSPDVLHATRMLNMNEEETLEFTAPEEPGEYPYVCTFPGHGEMMRGMMVVVE